MKILPKVNREYLFSPLRYPGGKSSLFNFFEQLISYKSLKDLTYVEPYAGGAGAALALLISGRVRKIVINDLDQTIYSFWNSVIYRTEDFIEKIESTLIDINEWYKQKQIYKNTPNEFDLGFATFFLNRTNRSGIINAGPIGGMHQQGKWKIDARFNKRELIRRVLKISSYRNSIEISNNDGIKLLDKIKDFKNLFIYLDPPYYDKADSLYMNHYKNKNHEELAEFLNRNAELNWVMTYDNVKEIRKLYSSRKSVPFILNYSAYKKMKGSELMIFSDSLSV